MASGDWRAIRPVVVSLLLGVTARVSCAHEHWIDADRFYPRAGETVTVHVCSGHYFPKSSLALSEKVLEGATARGPDGVPAAMTTTQTEKRRTASLAAATEGVYVLGFSLKRPRAKQPNYEGKAIVVVGAGTDNAARYGTGTGLELIPGKPVSALRPGDELPVSIRLDGEPVAASVSVTAERGRTRSLSVTRERPAFIRLPKPGPYLVTTSLKGRGCSLVFMVREEE